MSYFDDASLVMIPSGYKTSKVYSVKPTDGSGDLTFSRSNDTATRVNSAGLIEKVRTNVIPYSQAFDNAIWSKDGNGTGVAPSVTANNATAPDGTLTADTIVFNAGAGTTTGDSSVIYQAITLTGSATASFYARVTSGTGQLVFRSVAGSTYTTANLTTTWQRFSAAENGSSGFFEIGIRRGLTNEPINASVTVQMWGAQLEAGDVATAYIATTSAAVSVGPVANVPRLDYLNSSCPRLLLEPQRTNLITFSESFDNAAWSVFGATVTANAGISPDGTQNADKLIEDTSTGNHRIVNTAFAVNNGNAYSQSWYVKYFNNQWIQLNRGQEGSGYLNFDLINGVVGYTGGITDYQISNMANGWYRISINYVVTGTYATAGISILNTNVNARYESYVGDGISGVYIWGCQYEQSSYPTSYIPTLGATVTRGADACSKTGISSLIGQTEGTVYWEGEKISNANFASPLVIDNGTSDRIYLLSGSTGFRVDVTSGGTSTAFYSGTQGLGTYKIAIAYSSAGVEVYINGASVFTDSSVTIPACQNLYLSNWASYTEAVKTSQALLFKTRLTNAQLAELTTL